MNWSYEKIQGQEKDIKGETCWVIDGEIYQFGGQKQGLTTIFSKKQKTYNNGLTKYVKNGENGYKAIKISETDYKNSSLPKPRKDASACVFKTGKMNHEQVLVYGGSYGTEYLDDIWMYDPFSNLWRPILFKKTDDKPQGRSKHSVVFHDDKMWVFGGQKGMTTDTNGLWCFDVNEYSWKKYSSPTTLLSRSNHTATVIENVNGDPVMCVTFGSNTVIIPDVWTYNFKTGEWKRHSEFSKMEFGRQNHAAVYLGNKALLIHGGYLASHLSNMFIFDFSNGSIHNISSSTTLTKWPQDRCDHHLFYDEDSKEITIVGGEHLTGCRDGVWTCNISHIFSMFNLGKKDAEENFEVGTIEFSRSALKTIDKSNKKLKDKPNDFESLLSRCEAYCEIHLYDKCLADVEAIQQIDPDNLEIKIYEALCFYHLGEHKKVIKKIKEISSKKDIKEFGSEKYEEILSCRAKSLFFNANFVESLKDCEDLLEIFKKQKKLKENEAFDIYHVKAECLFSLKKYEESIQTYDEAIKIFKSGLLSILSGKNTKLEALEEYKLEIMNKQKKRLESIELIKQGETLFNKDNFDEALKLFDQAIELDPDSSIGHAFISEIYLKRRNFELSKEAAKKCIESDRKYWKGYYLVSEAYIVIRHVSKAIKYLEEGLKKCDNNQKLQDALEDAKTKQELYEKASEFADTAQTYLNRLMINEAIEEMDHALELDKDNSKYYSIRSQCYLELKDFDKAEEDSKKAIDIDPLMTVGYLSHAEVLVKQRKYSTAIDILETCLKKVQDPDANKEVSDRLQSIHQMLNVVVIQEKNFKKASIQFELYEKQGFEVIDSLKENTAQENLKFKKILSLVESSRRWDSEIFDADSILLCAKIFYKMKNFSDCIEDCKEIISNNPKAEEAYILIALSFSSINLQKYSQAIEKLNEAKKVIGSTERIKSTLKKVENAQKNYAHYRSIIDDAHVARQGREFDKAIETYKKALVAYPNQVNTLFELAFCEYNAEKYDDSLKNCLLALEQEPSFPHINNLVALNYLKQKKLDEALNVTQKALKMTPFNTVLIKTWSEVKLKIEMRKIEILEEKLQNENDIGLKIDHISNILLLIPSSIRYLIQRAQLYVSQERYSKAARDCKKIIECGYSGGITEKQVVEANYLYAKCFYAQQRFPKAFSYAEKAAKINFGKKFIDHELIIKLLQQINKGESATKQAQIFFEDAKNAYADGDLERSMEFVKKAIKINPMNELYHALSCKINLDSLHKDAAFEDAKTVLDINPFEPDNMKLLVTVYRVRFEFDEAIKQLTYFIEDETDQDVVKELQDLIEDIEHSKVQQRKAKDNHDNAMIMLQKDPEEGVNLLYSSIQLDKSSELYQKDYIDALIKLDRLEEALEASNSLLKEFPNSIDSYLTRFNVLNLLQDYNQSLFFITNVLEKFPKEQRVFDAIKVAIKNELSICKYSYYYKFEQFESKFSPFDISEYLVDKAPEGAKLEEISLDSLLGDDFGLDDLGLGDLEESKQENKEKPTTTSKSPRQTKKDEKPKLTIEELFQMSQKQFPELKAMRNFAQKGVDFYTVGKKYLDKLYESVYKVAIKALYCYYKDDVNEVDEYLRKAFYFSESTLKDYLKSLKLDKVSKQIAAQRYYEIVNDKHRFYKKVDFDTPEHYEAWKNDQIENIKKLCPNDDLSILLEEWTEIDYHSILTPLVSALFLYDKNVDPKFIPSQTTMEILDVVIEIFNFGSKKYEYLTMIKSLSGFSSSISECSLKLIHVYNYLLLFVNEFISNPNMILKEQQYYNEVTKPILNYVSNITNQFYNSKNEKMRQVIIMGFKITSLIQIFDQMTKMDSTEIPTFLEKTNELYLDHIDDVLTMMKEKAFKEEFTPSSLILYIKALSQYLETCQIYFVDLFSYQIPMMKQVVIKFYDELDLILMNFGNIGYKRVPSRLFDVPFELKAIFEVMKKFLPKLTPFKIFNYMQSHFSLYIHESTSNMMATIEKSVNITKWESLTEQEKHTASVIDLFSTLENGYETYQQLLEIIKPIGKNEIEVTKLSVDLMYYVFSKGCCKAVDFYGDLMEEKFKDGDFKIKALCVNNMNAILKMLPKFSMKILIKLVKEDETLKIWDTTEKRIKTMGLNMLSGVCHPILDRIKETVQNLIDTKTIIQMRIEKLQQIQIDSREYKSLVKNSVNELLSYIEDSLQKLSKYLSNVDTTSLYKETLDLLLNELKEIIHSNQNSGKYKNLNGSQVRNLKESFELFKEFYLKNNVKEDFLNIAFQFLEEIYDYSNLETPILILKYFDLIEDIKKNPTFLKMNIRIFIHSLLASRNEMIAIELIEAEGYAQSSDVKKSETKEKTLKGLINQFETKKRFLKEESTSLRQEEKYLKESLKGLQKGKLEIEELKIIKSENNELQLKIEKLLVSVKKEEKVLKNLNKFSKKAISNSMKVLKNEPTLLSKDEFKAKFKLQHSYEFYFNCISDYEGGYLYFTNKAFYFKDEVFDLKSIIELLITTWSTVEPALNVYTKIKEKDFLDKMGLQSSKEFVSNFTSPISKFTSPITNLASPIANLASPITNMNPWKDKMPSMPSMPSMHLHLPNLQMFKGADGDIIHIHSFSFTGFDDNIQIIFDQIKDHVKKETNHTLENGVNILGSDIHLNKEITSKYDEGYDVSIEMKEGFNLPDGCKAISAYFAVNVDTKESGTFYLMTDRLCFDGHKRGKQSDMNVRMKNIDYLEMIEGKMLKIVDISTQKFTFDQISNLEKMKNTIITELKKNGLVVEESGSYIKVK
eukprot:gene3528-6175_t